MRKRWVTNRRSVTDTRVVHLPRSRRGRVITRKIEKRVSHVEATLAEQNRRALGMNLKGSRA